MNDEGEFKYIAVRNFETFQTPMKYTRQRTWVKFDVNRDLHNEYSQLSCFQRYILDGLTRLRGRLGTNIPNRIRYIANNLCVMPEERHCIGQAIAKLVASHFLVLCNEEKSLEKAPEIEKEKEIEKEIEHISVKQELEPIEERKKTRTISDQNVTMIYDAYPKHVGRADAVKAIHGAVAKLCKTGITHEEAAEILYQAVKRYAASPQGMRPDKEFIPYPATWFNKGRYYDDPKEWEQVNGKQQVTKTQQRVINNRAAILEGLGYSELSRPNGAHAQPGTPARGSKTLEGTLSKTADSSD